MRRSPSKASQPRFFGGSSGSSSTRLISSTSSWPTSPIQTSPSAGSNEKRHGLRRPVSTTRQSGVARVDIDGQQLAESLPRVLRALIGVEGAAAVPKTEVQATVRAEGELPAVVVLLGLIDEQQLADLAAPVELCDAACRPRGRSSAGRRGRSWRSPGGRPCPSRPCSAPEQHLLGDVDDRLPALAVAREPRGRAARAPTGLGDRPGAAPAHAGRLNPLGDAARRRTRADGRTRSPAASGRDRRAGRGPRHGATAATTAASATAATQNDAIRNGNARRSILGTPNANFPATCARAAQGTPGDEGLDRRVRRCSRERKTTPGRDRLETDAPLLDIEVVGQQRPAQVPDVRAGRTRGASPARRRRRWRARDHRPAPDCHACSRRRSSERAQLRRRGDRQREPSTRAPSGGGERRREANGAGDRPPARRPGASTAARPRIRPAPSPRQGRSTPGPREAPAGLGEPARAEQTRGGADPQRPQRRASRLPAALPALESPRSRAGPDSESAPARPSAARRRNRAIRARARAPGRRAAQATSSARSCGRRRHRTKPPSDRNGHASTRSSASPRRAASAALGRPLRACLDRRQDPTRSSNRSPHPPPRTTKASAQGHADRRNDARRHTREVPAKRERSHTASTAPTRATNTHAAGAAPPRNDRSAQTATGSGLNAGPSAVLSSRFGDLPSPQQPRPRVIRRRGAKTTQRRARRYRRDSHRGSLPTIDLPGRYELVARMRGRVAGGSSGSISSSASSLKRSAALAQPAPGRSTRLCCPRRGGGGGGGCPRFHR